MKLEEKDFLKITHLVEEYKEIGYRPDAVIFTFMSVACILARMCEESNEVTSEQTRENMINMLESILSSI